MAVRTRKLRVVLASALICLMAIASCPAQSMEGVRVTEGERMVAFETRSFTHSSVDIAPDGETLLFDLLGHLYKVSIHGGRAVQLTQGTAWHMRPRFSPDGKRIAYISDLSGRFGLWVSRPDGTGAEHYPGIDTKDIRYGSVWNADAELIDPQGDGEKRIHAWTGPATHRVVTSQLAPSEARGAYSSDGRYVYYSSRKGLFQGALRTGVSSRLVAGEKDEGIVKVQVSHDGSQLAYFALEPATDKRARTCVLRGLNLRSGRVVQFEQSRRPCVLPGYGDFDIPDYAVMPDGSAIFINDAGELARFDVASGAREAIPITVPVQRAMAPLPPINRPNATVGAEVQAKVIRWPALTPDGSRLVFSAFSRIHVKALRSGSITRLTQDSQFEHSPAISPDGRWVAYATWSDLELGHIMIAPLYGGPSRRITSVPGRYINPVWSHDGSKLAFIADEDLRARDGLPPSTGLGVKYPGRGRVKLQWAPIAPAGVVHHVADVVPTHWMLRRFYPVPTFLPGDTRLAVPTNLWPFEHRFETDVVLLAVNLDGTEPTHLARLPNAEEAVVSPDGRHIALVAQGELSVVPLPDAVKPGVLPTLDLREGARVPGIDPVHVSWSAPDQLVWAEGAEIRRYDMQTVGSGSLAKLDVRQKRFRPDGCMAFVNARLVTMENKEVIENGTLQICNDRIVAIGPTESTAVSSGAHVIDAKGATLIPGLVDTHDHMHNFDFEILPAQETQYVANLAYGVTTIYDPQTSLLDAAARDELVAIDAAVGPRIFSSGPGVTAQVPGSNTFSHRILPMRTMSDARAAVAARVRYSEGPLKSYADDSRSRRQWFSKAAREAGVTVTSHPYGYEHAMSSLIDGISIEHSPILGRNIMMYDDALQFIAASGVGVTIEMLAPGRYPFDVKSPKLNRLIPRSMLDNTAGKRFDRSEFAAEDTRLIARLDALGGLPTISVHGNFIPGLSLHHEIWNLVDVGQMAPQDALRVASLNGAMKIGMSEQIGSLRVGKLADLIVLNSNPLEQIQNSTDIRYVVQGGVIYEAETMTRVWPSQKPLSPWRWQNYSDGTGSSLGRRQ